MTEWSNIRVPTALKNEVEGHISNYQKYNSLSDFVKQACREKLDEDKGRVSINLVRQIVREEIRKMVGEKKGEFTSFIMDSENPETFILSLDPSGNMSTKIAESIKMRHYSSTEDFIEKAIQRQLSFDEELGKAELIKNRKEITKDVSDSD